MANVKETEETQVQSLNSIFNEGLRIFNALEKTNAPSNSPEFQADVKNAMKLLEQATRLASYSGLFSKNEGIEEVATNDLQYMLLPVLLGLLSMKLTSGERKDIIDAAEVYFKDFLNRCNDYNLSSYEFKTTKKEDDISKTELEKIATTINTRANKIERFRQQKALKAKLLDLEKNMANENVDDEIKRDYFITMLKEYILQSIDEINSIEMEKPILEHMLKMKKEQNVPPPKGPVPRPLKPIIITKDEVQKAVFGAGYPSLPTMTVKEFYDKRVADGIFPDPNKKPSGSMSMQQAALAGLNLNDTEQEAAQLEETIESDDPEYLERIRQMDEFKDEHRRGWGNRMNRS